MMDKYAVDEHDPIEEKAQQLTKTAGIGIDMARDLAVQYKNEKQVVIQH